MNENQEKNSFIEAMEGNSSPANGPAPNPAFGSREELNRISKYAVNPSAESTVNGIASFLLIMGCIACFICLIVGMGQLSDSGYGHKTIGWTTILTGIIVFVISLIQWAFMKVFVNISRNLYNINDILHQIKEDQ